MGNIYPLRASNLRSTEEKPIPGRIQAMVYAVAFFAGSQFPMISVIMPLWALELNASPILIGLIISSRQILVVAFSIHSGALLDRFGPRGVIVVMGAISAVLLSFYPAFPMIWAAILLQMISGYAETTNWIGAQMLVGHLLGGKPVYAGRMTASTRLGGFCAPVLVGFSWELFGPVAGFGFAGLWVAAGVVLAWFLPNKPFHASDKADATPDLEAIEEAKHKASILPKMSDYVTTLRLLLLPAVALVICATFMRQAGSGVQSSFYGVWLKEIGFTAGTIGMSNGVSAVAALTIGPLTRVFAPHKLLIAMTMLAVVAIAVTPLLATFWMLSIAICFRGIGQGLNFPLMLSIALQAVSPNVQGRVVAMRTLFNKFGGALVPLFMGAMAEFIGIENSFYVMGVIGVVALSGLGIWTGRSPAFAKGAT